MAAVQLKDHKKEDRLVRSRFVWAAVLLVLLTLVLIARLYYLQVILHQELATKSDENRIHLQAIPPTRGLIHDAEGRLLAENLPSYDLTLTRERVRDLDATLALLGQLIELDPDRLERFRKRIRLRRPFEPVVLKPGLSEAEIARIAVHQYRLPGVEVQAQLVRHYPYGKALAHSVGYVGRINDRELAQVDPALYTGMDVIGKIGLERRYESDLLGLVGYQEVETDASGRVLRVLDRVDPQPGADLQLYLNLELQQAAIRALAGRRGAVVALDPNSGGVLAMASTPGFDPNLFVSGISGRDYAALRDDIDRPLYNRASMGEYPPASTIKPMMAVAALDSDTVTPEYKVFDPGYFQLPGDPHRYRNWKRSGHGWVDLTKAVMVSNDIYFYDVAVKMGIDIIHDYMTRFGLGLRTGLDIREERPGLMPSRAWKRGARGRPWYPGETVIAGIGQGYMLVTPMQLALATAVIANRGHALRPRLVRAIDGAEQAGEPLPPLEGVSERAWSQVVESMRRVVHDKKGTAYWSIGRSMHDYTMAGKTGTAQVVGIAQDAKYDAEALAERHRDHGLFTSFAPLEKPSIVVAVIVENGGGGSAAAPVAKAVTDAWLLEIQPRLAAEQAKEHADG